MCRPGWKADVRAIGACLKAGVVALAAVVNAPAALAHESATGIVKERMDAMKSMAQRVKRMRTRIKAGGDLTKVGADARGIAEVVGKVPPLFPPGSTQHPSEASEKIWRDFADFEQRAKAVADAARRLAGTDAGDVKAVAARLVDLTKACGACHEKYRVKR